MKYQRIQLSRRAGFNLQHISQALNGRVAVNCARPAALGNPFVVGKHGTRTECVELHRKLLAGYLCISLDRECIDAQRRHRDAVKGWAKSGALRGVNLACWCKGAPCHADTLFEVFNRRRISGRK